jgi:cytosine/adenosine deaminase-related metal-dependent hydrolase
MILRAAAALIDGRIADDVTVIVDDDGRIAQLRPGSAADGPARDGLLLPGLVNAHVHLEFAAHPLPRGTGFPAWAMALRSAPPAPRPDTARSGALQMAEAGVVAALDVTNVGDTAAWLASAGLTGIVAHEVLGFGARGLDARIAALRHDTDHGLPVRPAPHALFSTHAELVRAAAAPGPVPTTIHVGEDPDERRFLMEGRGPFRDLLDSFGVDVGTWRAPGCSAVALLAALGALRPDVLLVHAIDFDSADIAAVAAAGAPVVLCPRSNLAISGRMPPVRAFLAAGIPLAIGTDSLASAESLDPMADVAALVAAFADVDPLRWLVAATQGGADAIGRPDLGRLAVGARPGLLLLHGIRAPFALATAPERTHWRRP